MPVYLPAVRSSKLEFPIMERLRTDAQFERVRKEGRTWSAGLVVLNAAPNSEGKVRCGFITGKKVGNSVERNRARRLIREAVRLRLPHISPGWDLVWIARSQIKGATLWDVLAAVDNLLKRSRTLSARAPLARDATLYKPTQQQEQDAQSAETYGS